MKPKRGKQEAAGGKLRATFHLAEDVVDEVRNAVTHLSGPPLHLTMTAFAEAALRREVTRLKKKYNDGVPFPARAVDPRGGRPVGS